MPYAKYFIPLESDPEIFTDLMHDIGVSHSLQFTDVWSFDDIHLQNVRAYILVVPPCAAYEKQKTEPTNPPRRRRWQRRDPESPLDHLLNSANPVAYLEQSEAIEKAHTAAALRGSSDAPAADAHVEHHYICFLVKKQQGFDGGGKLFVLDGDMEGPIEKVITAETREGEEGELVVSKQVLDVLKEYVRSSEEEGGTYSLMALVKS